MGKKELICIGCPLGCMITVSIEKNEVISVEGNTCIRGDKYARREVTNPTRIVTSSVIVKNGDMPLVSVKTKEDVPKSKIKECIRLLKNIEVEAPVHIGDIILQNVADTGVSIVATRNVEHI